MVANRRLHRGAEAALSGRYCKFLTENDFRLPRRRRGDDLQSGDSRRTEREMEDGGQIMNAPQTGEFAHIGKAVVIKGKLDGSVNASDRVDLRKSAVVTGDVTTQRIAIEEGAFLKGKVDIQKEAGKAAVPASS